MFYSHSLLSKKGSLGNIWIASYCFKKLKKQQIAETDITSSVDKIIPEVQISYRILAQLLLGVVKIYSKQVDYLYHDCNEVLISIRRAFSPLKNSITKASLNLPKQTNMQRQDNATTTMELQVNVNHDEGNACSSKNEILEMQIEAMCAPYHKVTITLPDCFELDAFDLGATYEGETMEHHKESTLEDEWAKEKDQHTTANEHHIIEADNHSKDDFDCFSPIDDGMQSSTLDFEIDELCHSSTIVERHEVRGEDNHGTEQEQTASSFHTETQFDHLKDQVGPATPNCGKAFHDKAHGKSDVCVDSGFRSPKPSVTTPRKLQSPNFAVATPARKDRRARPTHRPTHRKRKRNVNILFDETIVLPNRTMSTWIHDASDLVCKRRKMPHTSLDVWKAYRFTYLPDLFTEPVLPYISLEHNAVVLDRMYGGSAHTRSFKLSSSVNIESMILDRDVDGRDSFSSENGPLDNYSEIYTPEKTETRTKDNAFRTIASCNLETLDKELSSNEREVSQKDGGWSIRTREVAKCLYEKFLAFKEQRRKESLILSQILQGQTRSKAARFFYETLTLTGFGCIDVHQEAPYGDIIVSANPQLEALVKD